VAGTSSLGGIGAAVLHKSLGVGFLVGIGVMGSVSLSVGEPVQPELARASVASVPSPGDIEVRAPARVTAASLVAPPPSEPESSAVAAFPPVPGAPLRARPISSAARTESSPEPAPEQLAAELTALDRARQALASGRPTDALERLEQMDRQFRHPSLAQETAVVRIEALAKSGAHERASEQARSFLRDHPGSPYAGRVRRVLDLIRD
jgi:hypothetical protein